LGFTFIQRGLGNQQGQLASGLDCQERPFRKTQASREPYTAQRISRHCASFLRVESSERCFTWPVLEPHQSSSLTSTAAIALPLVSRSRRGADLDPGIQPIRPGGAAFPERLTMAARADAKPIPSDVHVPPQVALPQRAGRRRLREGTAPAHPCRERAKPPNMIYASLAAGITRPRNNPALMPFTSGPTQTACARPLLPLLAAAPFWRSPRPLMAPSP
jgi:hypothetical protein